MRSFALASMIAAGLAASTAAVPAVAAGRFFGFNDTTSTVFTGVFFAPRGGTAWGVNQALNDKDKVWDFGERLRITGIVPGHYDLKLVEKSGHVCIKHDVDLATETTFDVRDSDLKDCRS